jgi:tetratricopeptide (TPR) repeat protein
LIEHRHGRSEIGIEYIRQAIALRPDYDTFQLNLGTIYHETDRLDEAMACFHEAARLNPANAMTYYNMATSLLRLDRCFEAADHCRRAIQLRPDYVEAYNNLGLALQGQGQLAEAQAQFEHALRLKPGFGEGYLNLGNVLRFAGRRTEAIRVLQHLVRLSPHSSSAYSSLGAALFDDQQLDVAVEAFREALRLDTTNAEAIANLGSALGHQGHFDQAIQYSTEALRLRPNDPMAHWNRALFWMATGDFEQGLPEMEWRLAYMPKRLKRDFTEDHWIGDDLSGRTILLHAEGGFGDALQMVRYVPMVQQRGGRVLVECHSEVKSLLRTVPGVSQIVARGVDPLPPFDVQCYFGSLPRIFNTRPSTIPASIPYLTVDPQRVAAYRQRVAADNASLRVGLVWSGCAKDTKVNNPNCRLEQFAPLAAAKNVVFYSLQKGPPAEEAKAPPRGMNLVDWTAELTDFAETGALMANLDLIISVDTSAVHLAGALGYPTWVALTYVPDFRWLLGREDSPWYPTLRLFRQPAVGNWTSVFERIGQELTRYAADFQRQSPAAAAARSD